MDSYTLDDVIARLPELIDKVEAGYAFELTRNGKTIARVLPPEAPRQATE